MKIYKLYLYSLIIFTISACTSSSQLVSSSHGKTYLVPKKCDSAVFNGNVAQCKHNGILTNTYLVPLTSNEIKKYHQRQRIIQNFSDILLGTLIVSGSLASSYSDPSPAVTNYTLPPIVPLQINNLRTSYNSNLSILRQESNSSNLYRSSSGSTYQYNLANPVDHNNYSIDIDAQRRDQMSISPNRTLDKAIGQYGGGIYDND